MLQQCVCSTANRMKYSNRTVSDVNNVLYMLTFSKQPVEFSLNCPVLLQYYNIIIQNKVLC